jgi:hypothetical protein
MDYEEKLNDLWKTKILDSPGRLEAASTFNSLVQGKPLQTDDYQTFVELVASDNKFRGAMQDVYRGMMDEVNIAKSSTNTMETKLVGIAMKFGIY